MKKFILIVILLISNYVSAALQLNELNEPKGFMGRISNSDNIEKQISKNSNIEKKAVIAPSENQENKNNHSDKNIVQQAKTVQSGSYADLSLKKIAADISYELDMQSSEINSDLAILWAATTERSETMKYTIYKLANPDEDKPSDSRLKKILKPIASFSSVAGASVTGDPFVATGALIGGGLLGAVMKDDKEYNYTFSKVSDADMVLLIRKVDELQKKLLDLYVDYKTKKQLTVMAQDYFKKREEIYKSSQNKSKEELIIADVSYRNAKTNLQRARDDYATSRAILENLVGTEALKKIEQN